MYSRREVTTAVIRNYPLSYNCKVKEVMELTRFQMITDGTKLTMRENSCNFFLWIRIGRKVRKQE